MKLAVVLLLREDSCDGVVGGVRFEGALSFRDEVGEDWSGSEGSPGSVEGGFGGEGLEGNLSDEVGERRGDSGAVVDEAAVAVGESKEGLQFSNRFRFRPSRD